MCVAWAFVMPLLIWELVLCDSRSARGGEPEAAYDTLITGGTVIDGTGNAERITDVGIIGERIVAIGELDAKNAREVVVARGLVVAPGFINMLSWANESLLVDGRSQSDIRQGVTLEIFGEGWSMGPLNDHMRRELIEMQGDLKFEVPWTTLAEYLDHLVHRGVSCNVASFVGAATVRIHVMGYENRPPTPDELRKMTDLVRAEMATGALGVGSSLIYAPGFYADTPELIALAKAAAEDDGMYISHLRSEGNRLLEALEELLQIAREAGVRAEVYHLKAAGRDNWTKLDQVIQRIEKARADGLRITADMYPYTAGATGLDAAMPPWVQEGGLKEWRQRLQDPDVRRRVAHEMRTPADDWENLLLAAGSPEQVLLVGFRNPDLKHFTGQTLAAVAARRGRSVEDTAMDLVIEDDSRVDTVYFLMDEPSISRKIRLPWMSFCSDSASLAPEGVFLQSQPHPRAYGAFARLLGKYVRDEGVIALPRAIHQLTGLPAANLRLDRRGTLAVENFADVVVFDPGRIADHATYDQPHQYATGVLHVWVNGRRVLRDGEHTGETPGRVARRIARTASQARIDSR